MIEAVKRGNKLYQYGLFDLERPIAQQTAILANQNRDPKKQKKFVEFERFECWNRFDRQIIRELIDHAKGNDDLVLRVCRAARSAALGADIHPVGHGPNLDFTAVWSSE